MNEARFQAAVAAFDAENAADPNHRDVNGVARPRELVDAERLARWVERVAPDAPEALRLAARCQHLKRWAIPRADYPEGRVGYLKWRTALGRFHADEAARVLAAVGYDEETIERVRRINTKQGLRSDPLVQAMEDALCLAFLEHELPEFSKRHSPGKVVGILAKSWKKMSARGRELARGLELGEDARELIALAVQAPGGSASVAPDHMSDPNDERRRDTRNFSCIPAYVESKDDTKHLALIRDVSTRGARLFVQSTLPVGEVVHLSLYLSGDSEDPRPASGLVVRCEPRKGPREIWQHEIAVEFDAPIDDYADEIAELTRRQEEMGLFK